MTSDNVTRKAHRLAGFYPVSWRQRYGDEFEAYLEQEIEERPNSISLTLNVVAKGLFTRAQNFTWRVIFMQQGEAKFKAGVLIPIAVILGVAVASFSGWPIKGHHPWPAEVLIAVIFALTIFGVIHDSHRTRTEGPVKRLSVDRLVPLAVIEISSLWLIFRNEIGHTTVMLYGVLALDILLLTYKIGWLGRRRKSVGSSTTSDTRDSPKI